MLRLLGVLYVVMVMSEKKPKRKWWTRKREPFRSLMEFMESDVKLPTTAGPQRSDRTSTPTTPSEPTPVSEKRAKSPIPSTLVEKERAAALRLQMPPIKRAGDFVHVQAGVERFDTPIGRTLTREVVRRDWRHAPRVAIAHLPLEDMTRLVAAGKISSSHPTSPKRHAQEPKGRPTPKRPRKVHN